MAIFTRTRPRQLCVLSLPSPHHLLRSINMGVLRHAGPSIARRRRLLRHVKQVAWQAGAHEGKHESSSGEDPAWQSMQTAEDLSDGRTYPSRS